MSKLALTDAVVRNLRIEPGSRLDVFDTGLRGFGIRLNRPKPSEDKGPKAPPPGISKSWFLFYRLRGKQTRLTLGVYPTMGLAEARLKAHEALAKVARGDDPAAEKAAAKLPQKAPDTLATVAAAFVERGLTKKDRSPDYIRETKRLFDNHWVPRLGERALTDITRRDVIDALDSIAEEGTTRRTEDGKKHAVGGPVAANRALSAMRALYNWAVRRGLAASNPCHLVENVGPETRRERTLTAQEIAEVWRATQAEGYPVGPLVRMCLMTGQRRSEVACAKWADIDFKNGTWTLAADATKAGRSHVVPLARPLCEMLKNLPRLSETMPGGTSRPSCWLFTTNGRRPTSGFSVAKARLDAAILANRRAIDPDAVPMERWTLHDLRRTAATEMARLQISEFIVGKVLNHSSAGITGRVYNRYGYLEEKRHALDVWARYLMELVEPSPGKVLQLRASR